MQARARALRRVRQGQPRHRGLRARPSPRRRPDVDVAALRFTNFIGPADRLAAHRLLPHAGRADRARLRRPGAAPARGRRPRRAHPRDHRRLRRHGERRRRGHPAALPGHPPARPGRGARSRRPALGSVGRLVPPLRLRRLLAGADALPQLRPRRGHHGAARGVRLHPPLHDGGRVGRLRPHGGPGGVAPAGRVGDRPASGRSLERAGDTAVRRSATGSAPRPRRPDCGRCAMPEARVIPLRPDDDEPYVPPAAPPGWEEQLAERAGVPAPPADAASTTPTSSASTPTSPTTSCCRSCGRCSRSGSGSRPRAGERARRPAARWWSPTTRARCPSTR